MKVQSINNSMGFYGIYQPKYIEWTKTQEPIVTDIKKALREPSGEFKGQTAEEYYKAKGYDFQISPHTQKTVKLTAYYGLKEVGTGMDKGFTHSGAVTVGNYDGRTPFEVSDISKSFKEKRLQEMLFIPAVVMMGLAFLAAIFHKPINRAFENTLPKTEVVDTVAKSAGLTKDSLNIIKNEKTKIFNPINK